MNNQEDKPEIKQEDKHPENPPKKENAKFPDWDILPPNQPIKPR